MHAPLADQIKGCKFSKGKPERGALVTDPSTTYITFVAKSDDPEIDRKGRPWAPFGEKYGLSGQGSTVDDGEVSGCEFVRSVGYEGRAIAVERLNSYYNAPNKLRPRRTRIEYNVFGGSDPTSDGYFVNAI